MATNFGHAGELILRGVEGGVDSYERAKDRKQQKERQAKQDTFEQQRLKIDEEANRIRAQEANERIALARDALTEKIRHQIQEENLSKLRGKVAQYKIKGDFIKAYNALGGQADAASHFYDVTFPLVTMGQQATNAPVPAGQPQPPAGVQPQGQGQGQPQGLNIMAPTGSAQQPQVQPQPSAGAQPQGQPQANAAGVNIMPAAGAPQAAQLPLPQGIVDKHRMAETQININIKRIQELDSLIGKNEAETALAKMNMELAGARVGLTKVETKIKSIDARYEEAAKRATAGMPEAHAEAFRAMALNYLASAKQKTEMLEIDKRLRSAQADLASAKARAEPGKGKAASGKVVLGLTAANTRATHEYNQAYKNSESINAQLRWFMELEAHARKGDFNGMTEGAMNRFVPAADAILHPGQQAPPGSDDLSAFNSASPEQKMLIINGVIKTAKDQIPSLQGRQMQANAELVAADQYVQLSKALMLENGIKVTPHKSGAPNAKDTKHAAAASRRASEGAGQIPVFTPRIIRPMPNTSGGKPAASKNNVRSSSGISLEDFKKRHGLR